MTSQFADVTSSSNIFGVALFLLPSLLLVQVSCQYHTGSGVMIVYFCKGLTKNPEIRNTPT